MTTLVLKTGKKIGGGSPASLFLPYPNGQLRDAWEAVPLTGRGELTPEERREIADSVIACWNRWAETGTP